MPSVADVVQAVEALYPPGLAESWDAVGLVCGRPDAEVTSIAVCIDPTEVVVESALASGANFILAHHPLLLSGVNGLAATDSKGRTLHRLIEAGCALMTAHTNADSAAPGVSDALAAALGIEVTGPLEAVSAVSLHKLVVFVPLANIEAVIDALAEAGAGAIGDYDRCAYWVDGTGTFRPLPGASPHVGSVGAVESVNESRLEMIYPSHRHDAVVAALRSAHPYEEPAFDSVALASVTGATGLGRIGTLSREVSLSEFANQVAQALPSTSAGIRVAGELTRTVKTVAVCGGSGDWGLGTATAAGADVYVTSDLKHHKVLDHLADGGCAVIDVAHFASEFPWCQSAAAALARELTSAGTTVEVNVCEVVTDPWTTHVRSSP